jgi:pimeloyl-ACP methyl ester carboxylesterase
MQAQNKKVDAALQKSRRGKLKKSTTGRCSMKTDGRERRPATRYLQSAAAAAAIGFAASPAAASSSCAQLATNFHRPNTTITTALDVPAGTFVTPTTPAQSITALPAFCRVAGFTTPTSDSHIQFEVWLPESGWNLKYLQVGCGGFCGSISYTSMGEPLRRGYAVAATDDGHQASGVDASWAVGHPQKVIDFGYRSLKETTDVAKDIIMAFKANSARRSYFMGCSDGGREALMEAQRYPNDFDGIVAGSPANYWTHLFTGFVWNQNALAATATGDLSQADLNVVSSTMLAQCAGHDGGLSTDQFLNNPLACRFNPAKLSLTPDKVQAVEKIFSGPPGIFPGYRVGGDEASNAANWPAWLTDSGNPANGLEGLFGDSYFKNIVFPNSGWTPTTNSAAVNAHEADVRTAAVLNSTDPNLRPFEQHGGKLIQYVGWGDTAISPVNDINYYNSVREELGGRHESIQNFYRLFMVPGMAHCSGGPGATAFGQSVNGPNPSDPSDDILSALDRWVERGPAPDQITTTKYVNDDPTQGIAFQRPLCPFPQFAKYKGKGSTTSAASFACVNPDDDDHHDHDKEASNH